MLLLKHIYKEYQIDRQTVYPVLKDISISFSQAEFVALTGPSGCGKSTLLNIISGLDKPTSGDIEVNGIGTKKFTDNDWDNYRRDRIGFIFQNFNLIDHYTALENVELVLNIAGQSKEQQQMRAKYLLEEVGLKGYEHHLPGELSGGQQQRVAIARALANNPDIILADEPTGALDSANGQVVMELLQEIANTKLVLMVTHNKELAEQYVNRVVSMQDGKILGDTWLRQKSFVTTSPSSPKSKTRKMPLRETLKLAVNNMKKKRARTMSTIIAGSIGILGIALVLGLGNGINQYVYQKLNNFAVSNILFVQKAEAVDGTLSYTSDVAAFDTIYDNPAVAVVRQSLPIAEMMVTFNGEPVAASFYSLAPEENRDFLEGNYSGTLPAAGKHEVMLSSETATTMLQQLDRDTSDWQYLLGKEVTVTLAPAYQQVFTIAGINDEPFSSARIYYNYDDMKQWLIDAGVDVNSSKIFEVVVSNVTDNRTIADWLSSVDNGGTGVENLGGAPQNPSVSGFTVASMPLMFQSLFAQLILIAQVVLIVFMLIALLVSSIMIAISLYAGVLERKVEIGILRALGSRKKDIKSIFKNEAILIGFLAAATGLLLAFIMQPIINIIVNNMLGLGADIIQIPILTLPFTTIFLPGGVIIMLIAISVAIAYFAGLMPARRATKLQVIDALREE